MKTLICLFVLFITGCTSLKTDPNLSTATDGTAPSRSSQFNYEQFLSSLDSTNQKMRGELYRELKKDLSSVDIDIYMKKLNSYAASNALVIKNDLNKFDIKIIGYKKTFIFCAYSKELAFSLCDDPLCTNVESSKHSSTDETANLSKGLPLADCSGNLTTSDLSIQRAKFKEPEIILDHKYFKISYNKKHRLANYVQYSLAKENIERGKFKRTDKFFADPLLKNQGIEPVIAKSYYKSGYDKGHLAPAEDFSWSRDAIDKTFVMSNMTPQKGNLNQRAWKYLESRVRKWACGEKKIVISTGPILEDGLGKLNETVSIPKQFFKAILDETPPRKSVCFIYNQTDEKDVYLARAMTVRDCEKEIGFKLFTDLSNEEKITTSYNLSEWTSGNCK